MPGLGLLGSAPQAAGYALKSAAVMVNGMTLFTVTGGPLWICGLTSLCVTSNNGTASTIQYRTTPTVGSAQTISNASGSLASAAAGASVTLLGTALTTAANLSANGANLGMTSPILCPVGVIDLVVGVGSTTGTWEHYLYYWPLSGSTIVS